MPLNDTTLNNFARAFSERIAQQAIGLDETSIRIVHLRPAEQILSGFLTPKGEKRVLEKPGDENALDEQLSQDLPQDSPYEQTAIGFEWLAPCEALRKGAKMTVTVQCSVYVRRLPTFEEQRKYGTPRTERPKSTTSIATTSRPEQEQATRYEQLIQVWTREQIAQPLVKDIDLGDLLEKHRAIINLQDDLRELLALASARDLTPQRQIRIPEEALRDKETYNTWLARLQRYQLERQWSPTIDVRVSTVPTEPDCVRIALRLINRTPPLTSRGQEDYFDPNLYAVAIQADIPAGSHRSSSFRELPQSYRYDRTMPGIGINAHMNYQRKDGRVILSSDTVPKKEVARLEPRKIPDASPNFEILARDPVLLLRRILSAMHTYDAQDWSRKLKSLIGAELAEAEEDRKQFQEEMQEFDRGIRLLEHARYPAIARAFRLMNQVMAELGKKAGGAYNEWRLFQIVFIVSMLPMLAGREYSELREPEDDRVDLLWFAAGGGKTEAFLGLILWQAFFDRIRGKQLGVTAFVRFPLRLLTFQQLQRLGNALGQAELIRQREGLRGARFSLGFFVGGQVTDNRIDDDMHKRYSKLGLDEQSQKRIFQCPFCLAPTRLEYNASLRLIEHYCTTSNCPGGKKRLPVYVVDDDLYRYLPTVIVSTVDKMASLGQNQRFANLLGRFDMFCPEHGASFIDSNGARCPAAEQRKKGERPVQCGDAMLRYGNFHDPGPALLVQDELHLLSEELGTFDSHYETAVAEVSRSLGYEPWRIIAATATIQEYRYHSWQLYLKAARQFPCPGPAAYESFYYQQSPERVGRIFLGFVGVGRKHTPAVTRALTITYLELEAARRLAEQDPEAAASRYGTGRLSPTEWQLLLFLYELPLVYALTRKGSDMVAEAIESHVKKDLHELAAEYGELYIQMFNSGVDVPAMIETMQSIKKASPDSDPSDRTRGLVTTNIIGHGVDVDRFNIMIFAGFPRLVSEYIQASARVGRTYPGISIFIATPQSERDRGVFNRFSKFHEYLDRLVDPSAIARWPLPALERTVPGILAGYLMGVAATDIGARLATVEQVQYHFGRLGAEALTNDAILAWMRQAYGVQYAQSISRYTERLESTVLRYYSTVITKAIHTGGRPTALNTHLGAMRSLRDIDDPGYIQIEDQMDNKIVRRLLRGEE